MEDKKISKEEIIEQMIESILKNIEGSMVTKPNMESLKNYLIKILSNRMEEGEHEDLKYKMEIEYEEEEGKVTLKPMNLFTALSSRGISFEPKDIIGKKEYYSEQQKVKYAVDGKGNFFVQLDKLLEYITVTFGYKEKEEEEKEEEDEVS